MSGAGFEVLCLIRHKSKQRSRTFTLSSWPDVEESLGQDTCKRLREAFTAALKCKDFLIFIFSIFQTSLNMYGSTCS